MVSFNMTNIQKTLKSIEGNKATTVNFSNKTCREVLTMWLDYNGKPVKYAKIAPGGKHSQSTYVTHPWIVVELSSGFYNLMLLNNWTVCFPQETETTVDITDPGDVAILDCLATQYHSVAKAA